MIEKIRKACKKEKEDAQDTQLLQACFNSNSSAQTVYNLEVYNTLFIQIRVSVVNKHQARHASNTALDLTFVKLSQCKWKFRF